MSNINMNYNDPDNPIGYEPNFLESNDELMEKLDELKKDIEAEGLTLDKDEFWQRAWDDIVEGSPDFREEPRFSDTVSEWWARPRNTR